MTATLTSSVPATWTAMLNLIQAAAALANPAITVYPAELLEYAPGQYIVVGAITGHIFDIEAMGYQFIETYTINGSCTVYVGDSPTGTVPSQVMDSTYDLYTNIVMATMVANRGGSGVPVMGVATYPSPYQVLPHTAQYLGEPGNVGGAPSGWTGRIDWSYEFKAYIAPA